MALTNMAFIPGLGSTLLSLRAMQKKETITLDSTGVHLLERKLGFPHYEAGLHLTATRIVKPPSITSVTQLFPPSPPVVLRVIAPGNVSISTTIDINDMHVSYAHAHDTRL